MVNTTNRRDNVDELICALDIGTTKICALIARLDENNAPRVIGIGRAPARGLRRGMVINTTDAIAAIGQAIEQAEASAGGVTMESAYVSITGAHIEVLSSKGATAVGRSGRQITQEDCQRALEQARTIAMPHNREIINVVARTFTVDDEAGIQNPVGMFGYRLEVDASIITGATSAIANLTNCVQAHGLDIDDLVLQPLASGEAVLTRAERQAGVAVVDIGGGTTDIAIYLDSAPWHTNVLQVGGDHFVRDVVTGLRLPYDKAEALIHQFGHAIPEDVPADAEVRAPSFGQGGQQVIYRRALAEILYYRAEELIDLITDDIKRSGYDGLLPAGVVLTGGVAGLSGLHELARARLSWPVRIGLPNGLGGSAAELNRPEYATAVGLLLWGAQRGTEPRAEIMRSSSPWQKIMEYLKRLIANLTP